MEPLVSVEPKELTFELQRNLASKAVVNVGNTTDGEVLFRVKTTNGERYIVERALGVLKAKEAIELVIKTDVVKEYWSNIGTENNDKFLLQFAARKPETEGEVRADPWEGIAADKIQSEKVTAVPQLSGDWFKLDWSPDTLTFDIVLGEDIVREITVTNNETTELAYKLRTNKPAKYDVEPVSSVVGPGESKLVKVTLKSLSAIPGDIKYSNDSFMAKIVRVEQRPPETLWSTIRLDEAISQIIPVKLRDPNAVEEPSADRDDDEPEVPDEGEQVPKCTCSVQ